jgi:hypothetical protein
MRTLSPAYVVTSVVIGLCGSASYAAVIARSGTAMTSSPAAITSPANASSTGSSAPATNPASRGTPATGATTIDGSRSGNNSNTTGLNPTFGTSNASSFPNQATTAPNTVIGSSAASSIPDNSTTGASSVNSTGAITPSVNGFTSPVIVDGGAFGANAAVGERVDNGSVNANAATYAGAQVDQFAGAAVDVEASRNSQSFDRAVNTVKRDRQRIGRNGQLLQSIAPRTDADRSHEMPDDPPSPALTGSSSALTGR